MKPTIGRIVVYNTTALDRNLMREMQANVQNQLPATIVAIWPDIVAYTNNESNLKVELDGNGQLWRTSVPQGNGEGQWNWPIKEELVLGKVSNESKKEMEKELDNTFTKENRATKETAVKDDSKTKK